MKYKLEGKVVLITGASGGLGRALCLELAHRGARVAATDIDKAGLDAFEPRLRKAGAQALVFCGDICDPDYADAAVQRVIECYGRLDILIHNAGVTHFSRFQDMGADVVARMMDINFIGAVRLTHAALPALARQKGTLVAVSSVAGFAPLYARTGYAASKHAVQGFFESLRGELVTDNVQVMTVCPGFIATQNTSGNRPVPGARSVSDIPAINTGFSRPGSATRTAGRAMAPAFVAAAICDGLEKRRKRLLVGRLARVAYWLSRLCPGIYERMMLKSVKDELPPVADP